MHVALNLTTVSLTPLAVVRDAPVIPVIVLHQLQHAVPLARALVAGGIRMLEVTLRTSAALACIEAIARDVPEAVVGAGTVRSSADVRDAANAGARFLVSPGLTHFLAQASRDAHLPLLAGVATASDILQAQEEGLQTLKFFPAVQAGGLALLQAWQGPFGDVVFCPTGGIHAGNATGFLALPNVACVGGSWLAPQEALEQADWTRITALAAAAIALRPS